MYVDNKDYVQMRLVGTIVRDLKAGGLVTVLDVYDTPRGLYTTVCKVGVEDDDDEEREDNQYRICLDDLDLSSPSLGNIDFEGSTYYVSRLPKRNDWRQGLRKDNLVFVHGGVRYYYNLPSMDVLSAPVYNKYKLYRKGQAFSREFSVDKDGDVWYKCREKVGKDVDGVPILHEKFEWLKEALEDALER